MKKANAGQLPYAISQATHNISKRLVEHLLPHHQPSSIPGVTIPRSITNEDLDVMHFYPETFDKTLSCSTI